MNEESSTNNIALLEKDKEIIKRFRMAVFVPFILPAGMFFLFAMILPKLLRNGSNIDGALIFNLLSWLILTSFIPLIIYYFKTYSLLKKVKSRSTANPVVMLLLFLLSFVLIIVPWIFVIHLWIKSSRLIKESA